MNKKGLIKSRPYVAVYLLGLVLGLLAGKEYASIYVVRVGPPPEFFYTEKVEVSSGFYRGCQGVVEGLNDSQLEHKYQVSLTCGKEWKRDWVSERDLRHLN